MKKKIIYSLVLTATILTMGGCKKFLDVNTDPNNPLQAPESLILPPVIVDVSTVVAGGSFSVQNTSGIAEITSYWMQQISLNQPLPQFESYKFTTGDGEYSFGDIYYNLMQNIKRMGDVAKANNDHSYGVISKVLMAYSIGVTTDMWGDVAYSEAFDGNLHAKYDKQEDIYTAIQAMLDSAIAENQLDPGLSVPGDDDFLFHGDMSKWEKFAYALKARHYIHLTKAPGHDAVTQSNLALAALDHAFTGTDDEATANFYTGSAGQETPWYKNTELAQGGVVLGATLIDSLIARSDPRLPIIANKGSQDSYLGRISTSDVVPDVTIYSTLGYSLGGADINDVITTGASAPIAILPYSELEFIKAEATFRVSGAAAAQPIYQQAITDNMVKLGLSASDPNVTAYLAARGTLTDGNALQRIMEEKSIADLLSIENFNDWRRTGYPNLTIVANPEAGITTIPRRFQFGTQEVTSNPQPENTNVKITDRVWWDAAP
ncbi:SusD/RagB family nutrient-binding outer membrane lipoprotein [Ferruginibacter albus]|uniref:SusD/RagB family nutrient-binding outer membrane lipoprotein n=1 Tax=Ferruginibacter albus TaxID=2875540 RepID=UPI001CC479D6|nr:SusD/RagB family nutrient-binding outer membrane lipoprotein [Ferruginibacter albus]UAY52363.1 SusD/RagB family nutrient-binding outer membrane lipoprotein [Ferruginibacter albus]